MACENMKKLHQFYYTNYGRGYRIEASSIPDLDRAGSVVSAIQALSLFLLAYPAGNISSMMFQSVGKGMTSLMITLFRNLIFQVALAYLFGILLGYGMLGVYIGVIGGCGLGSIMAYLLSEHYIQGLKKDSRFDSME